MLRDGAFPQSNLYLRKNWSDIREIFYRRYVLGQGSS